MVGRLKADSYMTPQPLAKAIVRFLEEKHLEFPKGSPTKIIEPSAGEGVFVREAKAAWPTSHVTAYEIREECSKGCEAAGADFFFLGDWGGSVFSQTGPVDLILGNPPFSAAQDHVETALERLVDGGLLAFLLRLSFLGSQHRAKTLWDKPGLRFLVPVPERPDFMNSGQGDNSEYALYVWKKGYQGRAEILPPLWT